MPEWKRVRLGEVLTRSRDLIELQPDETYRQITVRYWHNGVVQRETKLGANIGTSRQHVARAGQFIISSIDARHGASGLVPVELNDAIVTNDFWLFDLDTSRLDPLWLDQYAATTGFVDACTAASEGSTRRVRLQPDLFASIEIPLPPLPEQRRIVARVKGLLGKVEEARRLRAEVQTEQRELLQAIAYRSDLSDEEKLKAGWRHMSLAEVLRPDAQREVVRADGSYPNFGIYSFGRGLFVKPNISGLDTSAQALYKVSAGQFIYSRLFAFEGSYGVVGPEFDGYYVSNEYPTFTINADVAIVEFLSAYFARPRLWPTLAMGSKGLGDRRQRIQPEQILGHELLVPPMQLQHELKTAYKAVQAMTSTSTISGEHANALPSAILAQAFAGAL